MLYTEQHVLSFNRASAICTADQTLSLNVASAALNAGKPSPLL